MRESVLGESTEFTASANAIPDEEKRWLSEFFLLVRNFCYFIFIDFRYKNVRIEENWLHQNENGV